MVFLRLLQCIGQTQNRAPSWGYVTSFSRSFKSTGCVSSSETTKKDIEAIVREKLEQKFQPKYLEVINESALHLVPKGSASHFRVIIVSHLFNEKKLVQMHRMVNEVLQDELKGPIHALSIEAVPANQSQESVPKNKSPPCKGGIGH